MRRIVRRHAGIVFWREICYIERMKKTITERKSGKAKGVSPMDAALKHLGYRARTVREMERYLDTCEFGEVEIMEAVERLCELNLLNDRAFAEDFVRTRLATKPVSREHLRAQLLQHELPRDVIDEALSQVPDDAEEENAADIARKYLRQLAALPQEEREARVIKRILARGYSYELAKSALARARAEADEALDGEAPEL